MSQAATTFRFNGAEFEFDIRDAEMADQFERATEKLDAEEKSQPKDGRMSDRIRYQCDMIKHFFDCVLGDSAGEKVCGSRSNLNTCYQAYQEFIAMVTQQKDSLISVKNNFSQYSNRQQRRHPPKQGKGQPTPFRKNG